MGAAASLVGESAQEFENFKKIRDEYENKVAAGASDTELYEHIQAVMAQLGAANLSLDMLTTKSDHNNCTEEIIKRANLQLLTAEGSKVSEVKAKIETALNAAAEANGWGTVAGLSTPCAVVSSADNFDSLRVPSGHYSRLPSDVYYCGQNALLRTQLTAHLRSTVAGGTLAYFMSGDIFRIIEEDDIQSEMQHKLEFVRIYDTPDGAGEEEGAAEYMKVAESIVKGLISAEAKTRWEESDEAFHLVGDAFNDLQMKFGEQVVELARGGMLTDEMLTSLGFESGKSGCIVTFDLDHLAMAINSVADIRQLHA